LLLVQQILENLNLGLLLYHLEVLRILLDLHQNILIWVLGLAILDLILVLVISTATAAGTA